MPKTVSGKADGREMVSGRRLLTRLQTAEYLGVSQATLSRWAADRTGPPFIKLHDGKEGGGTVRYPSDLLDEYIESCIRQPKAK